MEHIFLISLLSLLTIAAVLTATSKNLFAAVLLLCVYSLMSAAVFILLDAPDVAFTEAAVGAGLSTVLFLMAIALTSKLHSYKSSHPWSAIVLVSLVAGMLLYAIPDFPPFASPDAPAHGRIAEYYLDNTERDIGIPNVVTAVLASYRGFDTLGELVVIFTAGIGVVGLFATGFHRRTRRPPPTPESTR